MPRVRDIDTQVSWRIELVVKPGALENFRTLTAHMGESARDEPGVLCYERFVNQDGTLVHLHERYVDSAAAAAHLLVFNKEFGERFIGLVERRRFTVYGAPIGELKRMLDAYGAAYLSRLGGFCVPCKSPVPLIGACQRGVRTWIAKIYGPDAIDHRAGRSWYWGL